ncbi:MAG: hypothetical protein QW478_01565 [Candidatus Micrarchaeaceae archaeon]
MSFWELFFLLFATLVVTVSTILSSLAAGDVTQVSNYASDSELQSAHGNLTVATIMLWLTFISLIIGFGIILYGVSNQRKKEYLSSVTIKIIIGILVLVLIVAGILAAVAAGTMTKSPNFSGAEQNFSYRNAWVVSVLSIVGGVLILVALLVSYAYKAYMKQETVTGKTGIAEAISKETGVSPETIESAEMLARLVAV